MLYSHPIYTLILALVFGIWALSEFLGPVRWSGARKGSKRDRGSLLASFIAGIPTVVLAFLFPVLLPGARISWQPEVFFVGMGLVLLGIVWRWYAILTLGKYFTATVMIQEAQPVIQHGPYTFIRHPSYSGILLIVGGMGCMIGNWASLLLPLAALFISLLYRIAVEEEALLQGIGQPYALYRQRTKRLIPFVF
ncbi:MAG TPA: isoprenylcysteine carboxylmethyltransferase family protein [Ktedonobacteraceae bacterium]|nr:isoprenylcysteine carboxylmethyltransferase family protein [Ktedonobacteraceae bacterium]